VNTADVAAVILCHLSAFLDPVRPSLTGTVNPQILNLYRPPRSNLAEYQIGLRRVESTLGYQVCGDGFPWAAEKVFGRWNHERVSLLITGSASQYQSAVFHSLPA
jgi:hypothetical protein